MKTQSDTVAIRDVLTSLQQRAETPTGWFLPTDMLSDRLHVHLTQRDDPGRLMAEIRADGRFGVRTIGGANIIVPKGMENISPVKISSRVMPSPAFQKKLAFTESTDTDLGSLSDLLLHDLASVPSSGSFSFGSTKQLWSMRLPNTSILDALQLLGAASGASITIEGACVAMDAR